MTSTDRLSALEGAVFVPGANAFAIVDGASIPGLLSMLYQPDVEFECLQGGDLEPDEAEVAPYLVKLEPGMPLLRRMLQAGWGAHWGIVLQAPVELAVIRRHFRPLLVVYDESAKPMRFRYYDPRVLSVYLPTCNAAELTQFCGPVRTFLAESGDRFESFEFADGKLKRRKVPEAAAGART
jgi:hypothetical protein